jgi:hypothetical protein
VSSIFCARRPQFFLPLVSLATLATFGCQSTPMDVSKGPASLRIPRPGGEAPTFEDSLTGGEVFSMYCNQCHNARALAERPFLNYENVMAHMRVRANLTGKEYQKLLVFLRRWHDVPAPTPPADPSPKAVTFPQPIADLRDEITRQSQPGAAARLSQVPGNAGAQPGPTQAPRNAQPGPDGAGGLPAPLPAPNGPQPLAAAAGS